MRAAILREYGEAPEPGEFDDPQAGDGQVVVEVQAAGLNPVDLSMASGSFYAGSPPRGELTVDLERIPLDGVAEAWRRQGSAPGRKRVIVPG